MNAHFTNPPWFLNASIYEVNIRQYTQEGTFNAFEKHIPRLKEMGVDIIWLMPITPISQLMKKGSLGSYYACSSYTKINPAFGTEKDLQSLIKTIHANDMKVIIDWVANHTGRQHEWMEVHPEWFMQDAAGNFTERNGWEDVVDLNFSNNHLCAALIGAMHYWVDSFDIDGFRCDMAHLVPIDFWKAARKSFEKYKSLFWLAECDEPNYHAVFDASYAWNWMHATEKMAKGEASIHAIYNVLHDYANQSTAALKLFFTSNHDENSWNGTEYEKYGIAAKPWAVFTYTWKGIALTYSGQELPNYKRLEFFHKDSLQWNKQPQLHDFYKKLNALKKDHPVLINGACFILPTSNDHVMAFIRHQENKELVLVVLNLGNTASKITCQHSLLEGRFKQVFSELEFEFNQSVHFELLAGDYFVYVKI